MAQGFSLYLNLLRFAAAIVVLLSHFAYERFTRGDYLIIRELNLGSDAVVVFFVISGLVIAFAARQKDMAGPAYVFARLTRLFSVVLPAILLTLALDYWGARIDPAGYDGWWWNPAPVWEVLLRTLSFSTEWTGSGFRPGTNGPFWSLSYEAAYYLLFGIVVFLSGIRRAFWLTLVLIVVGVKPLLLMPSWLLGVWLYHRGATAFSRPATAVFAFAGALVVYIVALALDVPDILFAISNVAMGQGQVTALRFSNEFVWNGLLGAIVALHLAGAMKLFDATIPNPRWEKAVAWLAGSSFSLYLVHYPALQFWNAIIPQMDSGALRDSTLFAVTLMTCFVFASVFEHKIWAFRKLLVRLWQSIQGATSIALVK
ncbi:acyltransferase [Hwanghaeella grinnelliae]|uniref:Acyltransferase n=1 Tax=Hwanghaeella grinnelliae TaxID=2500179 RepID=A0A437QYT7_9PROT|nr:acyltransferase [Hwanghaeella grinnelliae]RVU39664.1 acyltransferase [Hwanghaeella grinnelliae]